ncbi:MAG: hypothetical protein QM805_18665 [Pseudomonas sp.]
MSEEERRTQLIDGPVGKLQLLIDRPGVPVKGIALISHPQPLLPGGGPKHRVPLTLSRKLCSAGWLTVRPSFRGVEGSEGEYAEGIGEAQDMLAVIEYLHSEYPICRWRWWAFPSAPMCSPAWPASCHRQRTPSC